MSKKIFCSKKPETLKRGGGPLDTSYGKVSWQYHHWFGYRSFPEYAQLFTSATVTNLIYAFILVLALNACCAKSETGNGSRVAPFLVSTFPDTSARGGTDRDATTVAADARLSKASIQRTSFQQHANLREKAHPYKRCWIGSGHTEDWIGPCMSLEFERERTNRY